MRNGKRCRLTLTRHQIGRILDWAESQATDSEIFQGIEKECRKALAYDAERRGSSEAPGVAVAEEPSK